MQEAEAILILAQEIMQKAESILTKENNFLRQVKIKHVTHMHKNNMDYV